MKSFLMDDCIDNNQSGGFGNDGCVCSSVETQSWQSKMAVDQSPVKYDIDHGFTQRTAYQETRIIRSDEECIAHDIQIQNGQTPDSDQQKINYLICDLLVVQDPRHEDGREVVRYGYPDTGNAKREPDRIHQKSSYFRW